MALRARPWVIVIRKRQELETGGLSATREREKVRRTVFLARERIPERRRHDESPWQRRSEPPVRQPGAHFTLASNGRRQPNCRPAALGSLVVVVEHVFHAVDTLADLVLGVLDRLLDLAPRLVHLAGAPQLVVVGEIGGGLLRTTLELVIA